MISKEFITVFGVEKYSTVILQISHSALESRNQNRGFLLDGEHCIQTVCVLNQEQLVVSIIVDILIGVAEILGGIVVTDYLIESIHIEGLVFTIASRRKLRFLTFEENKIFIFRHDFVIQRSAAVRRPIGILDSANKASTLLVRVRTGNTAFTANALCKGVCADGSAGCARAIGIAVRASSSARLADAIGVTVRASSSARFTHAILIVVRASDSTRLARAILVAVRANSSAFRARTVRVAVRAGGLFIVRIDFSTVNANALLEIMFTFAARRHKGNRHQYQDDCNRKYHFRIFLHVLPPVFSFLRMRIQIIFII